MEKCVSFNKVVLKVVARVPIFYLRVGRSIRLATGIVPEYRICHPKLICQSSSAGLGYKLKNYEDVSCHDAFYYLQCGKPNASILPRIFDNGPAIKGGCVTWRSHPATGPGTLAGKLSRWQDRYGVLFAVLMQVLLRAGAVAV
jgi:hypothetical protein